LLWWYHTHVKPPVWACGFLIGFLACSGAPSRQLATPDQGIATHAQLADFDDVAPSYTKAELDTALAAERTTLAARERAAADLAAKDDVDADALRVALADLAIERRFVASLEACAATNRWCPPRLDDPPWSYDVANEAAKLPLDAQLRFDRDDWRKITAELFGRACACRTLACVDSLGTAIDRLELRPMPDIRDDDTAAAAIVHARECLHRLRGKAIARVPAR